PGDTNLLGTGTLTNGVATYTTTTGQLGLGAGQLITATYAGNLGYTGSSGTMSQTVVQAGSTTAVSASANPSGAEQPVTFTATIAALAPGARAPTGTVTFFINNVQIGVPVTVNTVGGVTTASFTAAANTFTAGQTYTIRADYTGDTNFLASTGSLSQVVLSGTTTAVTASVNPS